MKNGLQTLKWSFVIPQITESGTNSSFGTTTFIFKKMDSTFKKAVNFLLLKNNLEQFDSNIAEDGDRVEVALRNILTKRALNNYKTILLRYMNFCKEHNLKWKDKGSVENFIAGGIKNLKWSARYSRMILSVLNKYILFDSPTKPRFFEIKKKCFRIVSNKFDTQSYNDTQIKAMLEKLYEKESNHDLFVLIALMAGTGLRFEETRQFTIQQIINLFLGGVENMVSCKTRRKDEIRMMNKFQAGEGEDKFTIFDNVKLGNECIRILQNGIIVRNTQNKTQQLENHDNLVIKNYESYRSRLKAIKQYIITRGIGVYEGERNQTRGSMFHSLRRTFATSINEALRGQGESTETISDVVGMGLRHTTNASTRSYICPSEATVRDLYNRI